MLLVRHQQLCLPVLETVTLSLTLCNSCVYLLQGMEHQDPQQPQQLPQQQQHDIAAALPTQQDPHAPHDPHAQQDPAAHQDPGVLAADAQQQEQEHHQQQFHDGGHEHDPGEQPWPLQGVLRHLGTPSAKPTSSASST